VAMGQRDRQAALPVKGAPSRSVPFGVLGLVGGSPIGAIDRAGSLAGERRAVAAAFWRSAGGCGGVGSSGGVAVIVDDAAEAVDPLDSVEAV
jgi:hypothetical protein